MSSSKNSLDKKDLKALKNPAILGDASNNLGGQTLRAQL